MLDPVPFPSSTSRTTNSTVTSRSRPAPSRSSSPERLELLERRKAYFRSESSKTDSGGVATAESGITVPLQPKRLRGKTHLSPSCRSSRRSIRQLGRAPSSASWCPGRSRRPRLRPRRRAAGPCCGEVERPEAPMSTLGGHEVSRREDFWVQSLNIRRTEADSGSGRTEMRRTTK